MRRGGGLFHFGDVVPDSYFTEVEIADLKSRGKITVVESRTVTIDAPAELEQPKELEHEPEREPEHEPEHEPEIDLGGSHDGKRSSQKRRRVVT
jgi:hypothetical protein